MNIPIAHLIDRHPDYTTFGDACLEACGGFSRHPQFWWHFDFPQEINNLTLKNYTVLTWEKLTDKLVSINILEIDTEIINYSTILVALSVAPTIFCTNLTDNNTTKSRTRKVAIKSDKLDHYQDSFAVSWWTEN